MLETMLKVVDEQIPKEEFRNIDNTPKHLIHMTDADFTPKSPAVLREELTEVIKEAKSKIKPVLMSKQDREKYIQSAEAWKEKHDNLTLFEHQPRGMQLLENEDISLEVLRKIQDKKFEIDLEYEKTRDLFEKQRVIDPYLVEHEEDNLALHGYYQNTYH